MNFCWISRIIDTFAFSRISMYVVLQSSDYGVVERAANGVRKRGGGGEGAVGKQYLTNTSMGSPKTKARNRSYLFFVSNLAGYERECGGGQECKVVFEMGWEMLSVEKKDVISVDEWGK